MKNRKKQYLRSLKLAKKLAAVAMLSATLAGASTSLVKLTSSNVYAAEYKSGQVGSNKLEFEGKVTSNTKVTTKPMDLIAIIDYSSSYQAKRNQALKQLKLVIEKDLSDDSQVMLQAYIYNKPASYAAHGAQLDYAKLRNADWETGVSTVLLKKSEALEMIDKLLEIKYPNTPGGLPTYTALFNAVSQTFGDKAYKNNDKDNDKITVVPFEDVYSSQTNKNKLVSVIQFTDGWADTEKMDATFADWAKKNAKTFMSVVNMRKVSNEDNNDPNSIKSMKDLGHPNIYDVSSKDEATIEKELIEQFKNTATESSTTTTKQKGQVEITPEEGITLKTAELVDPSGKKTPLTIKDNKVVYDAGELSNGKYTVNYTFEGNVKAAKKITASAKVDGKEVAKAEDTVKPNESKSIPRGTQYKANPEVEAGKVKLLQEMVPDTETEGESTETSTRLPQNVVVFTEASSAVGTVAGVRKAKDGDAPEALYPIVDKFQDLWKNMVKGDKLIFVVDENLPETFSGTVYVYEKGKDELSNNQSDIWKHRNEAATKAHGVDMFKAIGLKDDEIKRSDIRFDMDDLTTNDDMINGNPSLKAFITAGELLSVNLTKVDTPSLRSKAHTEASLKNANIKYTIGNAATITNPEVRVTSYHTKVQTPPKKVEGKDRIIEVGTKPTTSTEELAFKTIYRVNEELEAGQKKVVQEGVKGSKSVTTSYSLKRDKDAYRDDETYKDINKVTADILDKKVGEPKIVEAKDEIIEVGTKPKVEKEKIPYQTIEEQDPSLPEGERKVKVKGVEGSKTTTTSYTLDEKTGEVTPSVKTDEEPKVDEVILVGTKKKAAQVKLRFLDQKSNKSLKDDEIVTNDKSKFGDEFSLKPEKELKVGKDLYRLVEIKLTDAKEDSKIEGLSEDKKSLTSKVTESEQSYDAVYERVVYTSYVDENGKELDKTVEGAQDKKEIKGYDFVKTEKSDNGDVKHIYKAKPIKGKTPTKYAETNEKSGVMYSILGLIGAAALAESIRRKRQSK